MGLLISVRYQSFTGKPPLLATLTGVRKTITDYALFFYKTSTIPDLPSDLDKLNWKQTHTKTGLLIRRLVAKINSGKYYCQILKTENNPKPKQSPNLQNTKKSQTSIPIYCRGGSKLAFKTLKYMIYFQLISLCQHFYILLQSYPSNFLILKWFETPILDLETHFLLLQSILQVSGLSK